MYEQLMSLVLINSSCVRNHREMLYTLTDISAVSIESFFTPYQAANRNVNGYGCQITGLDCQSLGQVPLPLLA